jgi:hypothetical protein
LLQQFFKYPNSLGFLQLCLLLKPQKLSLGFGKRSLSRLFFEN